MPAFRGARGAFRKSNPSCASAAHAEMLEFLSSSVECMLGKRCIDGLRTEATRGSLHTGMGGLELATLRST